MTAEELHAMVLRWPEKYRDVPEVFYSDVARGWFIRGNLWLSDQHAATLIRSHAEDVLAWSGICINRCTTETGDWFIVQRGYLSRGFGAPTRLAAIDALIRQVEGIA